MPEAEILTITPLPRDESSLLELHAITVTRGAVPVLNGLSLSLGARGVTAIMGPNGAGKSLALRVLTGLILPDSGSVHFTGGRPEARDIALVFQRPVLLRRSVCANLDHALKTYGVPRRTRPRQISELLEMAGLAALAPRPARALSGGEQQRLALVRALGAKPRLLLLDEPTASLDPQATVMIERLIQRASADGIRVILVTHDAGQAARLADDVVFLCRGKVVEHSPAPQFFAAPKSDEAKAYLSGELVL